MQLVVGHVVYQDKDSGLALGRLLMSMHTQAIARFAVSRDGYKVAEGTGLIALDDDVMRNRSK